MPKKLAVFCDGTWNDLRKDTPTNVVRLAKCVAQRADGGDPQIVYYDEGVGVPSGISWGTDLRTKYLGGALGRGLNQKIEAAYRFLVLNFEPDDEIYVFGFSRGAYTARSLCGMIRKCGILRRDWFTKVPEAIDRYRSSVHPASPEMVQFRTDFAHRLASGTEDYARFGIEPPHEEGLREGETRSRIYQYRPRGSYQMMFAGIWDTVGALGIPGKFDIFRLNRRHRFHDTNASSLLSSVRHAIAANETRGLYDVAPFKNLDALNLEWSRATGWNTGNRAHPLFVPYAHRPYQQRWFPGDHCSVGGGYEETGLSSAALLWLAEGARWAGLGLIDDPAGELGMAERAVNPFAPMGDSGRTTAPEGANRLSGPANLDEISDPLYRRWASVADYRPPNLDVMLGAPLPQPAPQPLPPGFPPR